MHFHLNELVETSAGLGRIVGLYRDKIRQQDKAIVCLESGPKDSLSGKGLLVYVDWEQINKTEPEFGLQLYEEIVEPDGPTLLL